VEAGLRTFNKFAPFPEEINRRLTTHIADLHFAPTERARENLLKEGIPEKSIHVTGNTVIDALLDVVERIKADPKLEQSLSDQFRFLDSSRRLILVTGHRRESFGEGFKQICAALRKIGEREDVQIVYPVHLNPNVKEPVKRILGDCSGIHLIEPLAYLQFVYLMNRSYLIITDSGGVQEEAPSLGKPVVVMRDFTERPEAIESGTVKIVGTSKEKIAETASMLLTDEKAYAAMANSVNPYGDGKATGRILSACVRFLDGGKKSI
jgi:UDP-N-acetylglucosamine 2-epimerase (non-hydrolysing)